MADTFTTLLQLLKQETGNNNNNWGVLLNTQVIDRIETAIAGANYFAVTGGTKVLTDDEARASAYVITGVLTSAQIIEVPARTKIVKVINATTGNFRVTIRAGASGVQYECVRGSAHDLWTDGTSFYETAPGQVPVGSSIWHWAPTAPPNFIAMDGGALSRTQYNRLFVAIGTTWGTGDGSTTFNVPNAVGRYQRHRGDIGNGVGNFGLGYVGQDFQSHAHTGSSDLQGFHGHTGVTTTNGNHNHDMATNVVTSLIAAAGIQGGANLNIGLSKPSTTTDGNHAHTLSIDGNGSHSHNISVAANGNIETRPNSIVGLSCIRYQ
jgi:microcystin-dependent protein